MPAPDANQDLDEGHVFEGKYRIVRELGRGGFGVVYLAHQLSMDRPVALKVLKPGVGEHDPSARQRFLREVRIISKLRHPNTVTIHDYGETMQGMVYMVLEFVEGKTLKALLQRQGAQEPLRSLGLCRQIAGSLAEAHKHGIIHRDLKPANIMLTDLEADDDYVKVLDFGVAHLLNSKEDVDLTRSSVPEGQRALIGTPRYMSPEQVRGENLTPASDLYGLGLMLYEMLVGEPAVQGDTTMALISQQISPEPLRLPSLHALHPVVQQLIRRATDKSLARRFSSGREFAEAIDDTAQKLSQNTGAPAREFLATSGRFSAVSRSAVPAGLSSDSHPGQSHTPHQTSHRQTPGAQVAAGLSVREHERAGPSTPDDAAWFENQFDPQDLAERSETGVEVFPDPAKGDDFAVVGNQLDYRSESNLYGIPSTDLPPAPDAKASPFAVEPEPEEKDEAPTPAGVPVEEEESALMIALGTAKLCFLGLLAAFFLYTAFIVLGAMVGEFVEGKIRIAIAAAVAIAVPLFTALGENSQKERFEVVEKTGDRVARVFIGTAIISAAITVVMAFALPGQITSYLRGDPNWMFEPTPGIEYEPTPTTELNKDFSGVIADMIEASTRAIGRYDGTPTLEDEPDTIEHRPQFYTPPAPTRPGTRGSTDDDGADGADEEVSSESDRDSNDTPRPPDRAGDEADDDSSW